jgi:hypothetical protein
LFPRATASLASSNASNGVWSIAVSLPSRLPGFSSPRRSSQRHSEVSGRSSSRGASSRVRSSSSRSSPRIVRPAWRDAHVANVHQFAPGPVRSAVAAARRE